jgi:hypothetical protein
VPIDVELLIKTTWLGNQSNTVEQATVELSLHPDGLSKNAIHSVQGRQKAYIGVFDVAFVSDGTVEVMLREEECLHQLGNPRRPSHRIALLRPWKPIRVLLNGRSASHSGQHYHLHEYHLALCTDPAPDHLERARFLDLQADLA